MESGRSWSLRFRNRVAELFMPESSTKKQVAKLRQSTFGWWWLSLFVVALRVVLSFGCCHPGADFLGGGSSANLLRCRSDGSAQHSRFLLGADASKPDATVDTGAVARSVVGAYGGRHRHSRHILFSARVVQFSALPVHSHFPSPFVVNLQRVCSVRHNFLVRLVVSPTVQVSVSVAL